MDVMKKLEILTDSAKYDIACTSSGVDRSGKISQLGNATACGICHSFSSDGRCVSLLKVLMSNECVYDCKYCVNRISNDVPRTSFTPKELADLTMNFYKRNYIEGLFLSSAVVKNPNYTMELLYNTLFIIRKEYGFNGYIHVKAITGADTKLIEKTGFLCDRMSVNIEMPSEESLKILAPNKTKASILAPMKFLTNSITQNKNEIVTFNSAPKFVPAGQSTQMIIGATKDSDKKIVMLSEGLYKNYGLKRVFYSAYIPVVNDNPLLPTTEPPLVREHRLYQVDWLLRYYGFKGEEFFKENEDLSLFIDPKCQWAINNLHMFPVEIQSADYFTILRVPGIGTIGAKKIIAARKITNLNFEDLKKMNIVLKRAKYFITCNGKSYSHFGNKIESYNEDYLRITLMENKENLNFNQLSLFDKKTLALN